MIEALAWLMNICIMWLAGFAIGAHAQKDRDGARWYELRETVAELRDSGGKATQKELMTLMYNLMDELEKEGR